MKDNNRISLCFSKLAQGATLDLLHIHQTRREPLSKDGEWKCTQDPENKSFNTLRYLLEMFVLCLLPSLFRVWKNRESESILVLPTQETLKSSIIKGWTGILQHFLRFEEYLQCFWPSNGGWKCKRLPWAATEIIRKTVSVLPLLQQHELSCTEGERR